MREDDPEIDKDLNHSNDNMIMGEDFRIGIDSKFRYQTSNEVLPQDVNDS